LGLRRELVERNASDLPNWVESVDREKVEESKVGLQNALQKLYGDDAEKKIAWLNRLKGRVENGFDSLSPIQIVALTEVLSDLVLNEIKEV